MGEETWTVKRILDWIEGYLSQRGDDNARVSAQWLVSEAIGVSRMQLFLDGERPLTADERGVLRDWTRRRAAGEPLQYITGETAFRHITVKVRPGVLIPRPETEVLVSEALALLPPAPKPQDALDAEIIRRYLELVGKAAPEAQPTSPGEDARAAGSTSPGEHGRSAEPTSPGENARPAESTSPGENTIVARSTTPGEGIAVGESVSPGENAAAAESTSPGENARPAESTSPGENAIVARSTTPGEGVAIAETVSPGENAAAAESTSPGEHGRIAEPTSPGENGRITEPTSPGEDGSLLVADICTGSGCIACSIAGEHPLTRVIATDLSPDAVSLARENVHALGLGERVEVLECDLGGGVPPELLGKFDLVVSNPPYVPTGVLRDIPREVSAYEPALALDGGMDGLDVFRRLLAWCEIALKPGGAFAFELHETCLQAAADAAGSKGFIDIRIAHDLTNRPRILTARRP